MSPPRRRRRRRSKGERSDNVSAKPVAEGQPQAQGSRESGNGSRSRGRRRGRSGTQRESSSPFLSEDLVRALPKPRPATLTGPADGQTLEGLIGELQSEWGVPQYPQEYRITIKVADERDVRVDRPSGAAEARPETAEPSPGSPRREKAPAAPRVVATGVVEREPAPKRRRGRRRRKRGRDASDQTSPTPAPSTEIGAERSPDGGAPES
jgi:hypothetical protein